MGKKGKRVGRPSAICRLQGAERGAVVGERKESRTPGRGRGRVILAGCCPLEVGT